MKSPTDRFCKILAILTILTLSKDLHIYFLVIIVTDKADLTFSYLDLCHIGLTETRRVELVMSDCREKGGGA